MRRITAFLLTWRLLRLVAIEEMVKRVHEEILSLVKSKMLKITVLQEYEISDTNGFVGKIKIAVMLS